MKNGKSLGNVISRYTAVFTLPLCMAWIFTACGRQPEGETVLPSRTPVIREPLSEAPVLSSTGQPVETVDEQGESSMGPSAMQELSLEELPENPGADGISTDRESCHVASGREYDLYLEGVSPGAALGAVEERRLCFSVYDKARTLVQELVETSPYLVDMPETDFVEHIESIDWEEGQGHFAGNFYMQDMNFDGKEDLVLLWMNIRHPHWKVYLWREEEGIFREEPTLDGEEEQGVFCYYNISYDRQHIDEYIPAWDGHTIYRHGYDESKGYFCQGALSVHYGSHGDGGDQESQDQGNKDPGNEDQENRDSANVKYQEYFYENGVFTEETGTICQEEVSELWSDLFSESKRKE